MMNKHDIRCSWRIWPSKKPRSPTTWARPPGVPRTQRLTIPGLFYPHYLDSPRQIVLRCPRISDALRMTDAPPPSSKLFSHSCAISRSSKLELLENLSDFGRVVMLIAQIGTDAACCWGRSYSPTATTPQLRAQGSPR